MIRLINLFFIYDYLAERTPSRSGWEDSDKTPKPTDWDLYSPSHRDTTGRRNASSRSR